MDSAESLAEPAVETVEGFLGNFTATARADVWVTLKIPTQEECWDALATGRAEGLGQMIPVPTGANKVAIRVDGDGWLPTGLRVCVSEAPGTILGDVRGAPPLELEVVVSKAEFGLQLLPTYEPAGAMAQATFTATGSFYRVTS